MSRLNTFNLSNEIILQPFDNNRIHNLCGKLDENILQIEQRLNISILHKGNIFKVCGNHKLEIEAAILSLNKLYADTINMEISQIHVHLVIQECLTTTQDQSNISYSIRTPSKTFNTRNLNQALYIEKIRHNDINFGIGPAGTGKTFLAVAAAVEALERQQIRRIILVRPVVEAGEKLGFLPGDLIQKIDPYLRPLYDSLNMMYDADKVAKYMEQNIIEVAPLAYMRGRTLSDAFIILDEAQNTTKEQMKMFLTRLGFNATAVITGDLSQIDLPSSKLSGLKHAIKVLDGIKGISFTYFNPKDVVRHPIVQKIIDAYIKHEKIHQLDLVEEN